MIQILQLAIFIPAVLGYVCLYTPREFYPNASLFTIFSSLSVCVAGLSMIFGSAGIHTAATGFSGMFLITAGLLIIFSSLHFIKAKGNENPAVWSSLCFFLTSVSMMALTGTAYITAAAWIIAAAAVSFFKNLRGSDLPDIKILIKTNADIPLLAGAILLMIFSRQETSGLIDFAVFILCLTAILFRSAGFPEYLEKMPGSLKPVYFNPAGLVFKSVFRIAGIQLIYILLHTRSTLSIGLATGLAGTVIAAYAFYHAFTNKELVRIFEYLTLFHCGFAITGIAACSGESAAGAFNLIIFSSICLYAGLASLEIVESGKIRVDITAIRKPNLNLKFSFAALIISLTAIFALPFTPLFSCYILILKGLTARAAAVSRFWWVYVAIISYYLMMGYALFITALHPIILTRAGGVYPSRKKAETIFNIPVLATSGFILISASIFPRLFFVWQYPIPGSINSYALFSYRIYVLSAIAGVYIFILMLKILFRIKKRSVALNNSGENISVFALTRMPAIDNILEPQSKIVFILISKSEFFIGRLRRYIYKKNENIE